MRIGTFEASEGGFTGHLRTLTLDIELALVPAEPSDKEGAPDFRVLAGAGERAREVGAGWKHASDKAGEYLALRIDDPALVRPLRANLFRGDKDDHVLVWSRPAKREKTG